MARSSRGERSGELLLLMDTTYLLSYLGIRMRGLSQLASTGPSGPTGSCILR